MKIQDNSMNKTYDLSLHYKGDFLNEGHRIKTIRTPKVI